MAAAQDTACATTSRSSKDLGYTALLRLREVTAQEEVVAVVWMGGKANWASRGERCGRPHLHHCLPSSIFNRCTALDFTEEMPVDAIMEASERKRLTYRWTHEGHYAQAKNA